MKGIEEAEAKLLAALEGGQEIPPRELRQGVLADSKAKQGDLEEGQISLAFWRLLNRGEIELTDHLTVRRAAPLAA